MKLMKTILRNHYYLYFCILIMSCSEEPPKEGMSVTEITPKAGVKGDTITIRGVLFNSLLDGNVVNLDDIPLEVISATEDEIKAIIPEKGITEGCFMLNVLRNGYFTASTQFCINLYPLPNITSISPITGSVGDKVTIYGENLGESISHTLVAFSDQYGNILLDTTNISSINNFFAPLESANMDSIVVKVPINAGSGPIYIWIDPTDSDGLFEYYFSISTSQKFVIK